MNNNQQGESRVQELMKPRFKLIADYPGNSQPIGNVTTEIHTAEYFRKFTANFQELKWWEERKPEEMPEFVKEGDIVEMVEKWETRFSDIWMILSDQDAYRVTRNIMCFYEPAAESEYLSCLNTKSK